MQTYELGYLILPSIAEDGIALVVDKLKEVIAAAGGEEVDSESPERIDLAYTMTHTLGASRYVVNDAYIGWIKFDLPAEQGQAGAEHPVGKIKSNLENIGEILRFLLIRAPRESAFTFAKARAIIAEKAAKDKEREEAEASPAEEALVQ